MKPSPIAIIALLIIGAIYAMTLPAVRSGAYDSIGYEERTSKKSFADQFHPNHLLYNFVNFEIFSLWRYFGYKGSAEIPMKINSVIASLLALSALYMISSILKLPSALRFFIIGGVAFSNSFWQYSQDCLPYIVPIASVLLCFYYLLLIKTDYRNHFKHIQLAFFAALAALFHQQHLLLFIVVFFGYGIIFCYGKISRRMLFNKTLIFFTSYTFFVLIPYLSVTFFVKKLSSVSQIAGWVLGRAKGADHLLAGWIPFSLKSIPQAIAGFGKSILSHAFLFRFTAVSDFFTSTIPHKTFAEERHLVANTQPWISILDFLLLFLLGAALIFIVYSIIRYGTFKEFRDASSDMSLAHFALKVLLFYCAIYSIATAWWYPENTQFWIPVIPAALIILSILLTPLVNSIYVNSAIFVIVFCLLFINATSSVVPRIDRRNDYVYAYNDWLIKNCGVNDFIVTETKHLTREYIRYYTKAHPLLIEDENDCLNFINDKLNVLKSDNIYFAFSVSKLDLGNSLFTSPCIKKLRKDLRLVYSDQYQQIYLHKR
jgi:hypothetical protein